MLSIWMPQEKNAFLKIMSYIHLLTKKFEPVKYMVEGSVIKRIKGLHSHTPITEFNNLKSQGTEYPRGFHEGCK